MTAFTQGQLFQFKLDQTAVLLPTLANCVAMVKKQGIANAGDFSVKLAPKPVAVAAASPGAAGGSLKPQPPQNLSSEMQIEAIELASNFILKTSLRHPRVLSRAESPVAFAVDGAAWSSTRRLVPSGLSRPGRCQRSRCRFRGGSDGCKGLQRQIRLGAHQRTGRQRRGVPRLFLLRDSEGPRISQYFIVSRKKGGFVLFCVASNMKTEEARTVAKDERLADFRKAALVVVDH